MDLPLEIKAAPEAARQASGDLRNAAQRGATTKRGGVRTARRNRSPARPDRGSRAPQDAWGEPLSLPPLAERLLGLEFRFLCFVLFCFG